MFPWLYNWSPVYHFPFSGGVNQNIEPDFDWFFGRINPAAGHAKIEKRVFEEVGSYGKQLGLISEVLLELAETQDKKTQSNSLSLQRLRALVEQVESIKAQEHESTRQDLKASLVSFREQDPEGFERLIDEFRSS